MSMNTETAATPKPRREPKPLHGVDTPTLLATIDAVKAEPTLADFRFRATGSWLRGTHSRTTFGAFSGAGGEHQHKATYSIEGDHPAVLCGADEGPTPTEHLLGALAGCLIAGIGNIAAARGVELTACEATVEGDMDLQGILGIDDEVRNGFSAIRVSFTIEGGAGVDELRQVVEQSSARSAVLDVLTNGCPVAIEVVGS